MVVRAEAFRNGYDSEVLAPGKPFDQAHIQDLVTCFLSNGWVTLGQILSAPNTNALRSALERKFCYPGIHADAENDHVRSVALMRMFEFSRAFRDLIVLEPLIGVVEAILGKECHLISQTGLRTPGGSGIIRWHIDDELLFPSTDGHGAWVPPCHSLNVMIPLTDVDVDALGPTQVVTGSHLSGTMAPALDSPCFQGAAPVSIHAKAGEAYLLNHQTWHRGHQNSSKEIRFMSVTAYGRRFIQQRFYPFLNYQMPSHVLAGVDDRLLRLLGKHDKGPLG